MKIIADQHIPFVREYFSPVGELILREGRQLTASVVKDAEILLVRSVTQVNAQLLKNSHIKFVGSVTAGADHLDVSWLQENGIAYRLASGFNAPPVANYVVSILAALNVSFAHPLRIAIIGVGNVGKLVLEYLQHFPCELIFCDPLRAVNEPTFKHTPLNEIANCDVVSIHVPLRKEGPYPTWQFIDKNFLERQKPNAILINTSRGAVINEADLLEKGRHLRWCFDVWAHEPNINPVVLAQCTIATPHIAGYSIQSKRRGIEMIYQAACQLKMIAPHPVRLPPLTKQVLTLENLSTWQEVVLAIFNPLTMTKQMQYNLLNHTDKTLTFDAMRNHFQSRYEFPYTQVTKTHIKENDAALLTKLGIKVG